MKQNNWNDYEFAVELFESEVGLFLETSEEVEHKNRMISKGMRCKKVSRDKILKWRKRDWPSYELDQLRRSLSNRHSRNDVRRLNYEAKAAYEFDTLDILPAKKSVRIRFPGWGWLY